MRLYVLIKVTINNVFIIVLDTFFKKVLVVKSPGSLGFVGSKRKSNHAARVLGKKVAGDLLRMRLLSNNKVSKMLHLEVRLLSPFDKIVWGILKGLRVLKKVRIVKLKETIAIAHNGCRQRKVRRT